VSPADHKAGDLLKCCCAGCLVTEEVWEEVPLSPEEQKEALAKAAASGKLRC